MLSGRTSQLRMSPTAGYKRVGSNERNEVGLGVEEVDDSI